MRRTPFGSNFSLSGLSGLGVIDVGRRSVLVQSAEPVLRVLDSIVARVNAAADAGVSQGVIGEWVARRDLLRDDLERLIDQVENLADDSAVTTWQLQLEHLQAETQALSDAVAAQSTSSLSLDRFNVGVWAGAAVLGTIGAVLAFRWWTNLPSRRRRRR